MMNFHYDWFVLYVNDDEVKKQTSRQPQTSLNQPLLVLDVAFWQISLTIPYNVVLTEQNPMSPEVEQARAI